jgi:hypothetical protein
MNSRKKEGTPVGFNGFFDDDQAWLWIIIVIIVLLLLFAED